MRAVGYCRVATADCNDQSYGFEVQSNTIKEHAEQNKYELLEIYADTGKSGTSRQTREQLQRLLKDSESDNFDVILVKNVSTLSRSTEDLLSIIETFKKNNKKVYFISEDKEADDLKKYYI